MGNNETKLRGHASLPAENFPSMRLGPEDGCTNQGFSSRQQSSSFDNLNTLSNNGYSKKSKSSSKDPFLPVYKDDSSINETHFKVLSVIAKGAFGDVLKVQHLKDNAIYAMKVMQKKRLITEGAVQQSKDEATIQDAVGYHPLIVKPFWFFQSRTSVFIVMEYIPGGELFDAWQKSRNFSESLVRIYIAELASVLEFLHMSGIIFRDLKMENVLLDNRGHLHVTDFGLAKRLKRGQRTSTICGTLQYIAPEVVSGSPYGHPSDWWSLGILVYILLVGQFPVTGAKDHIEMAKQMKGARYELPLSFNFTSEIQDLLKLLLQTTPERRLTDLSRMKRHSFFYEFNFDGVNQMKISSDWLRELNLVTNTNQRSTRHRSSLKRIGLQWKEPVASLDGLFV